MAGMSGDTKHIAFIAFDKKKVAVDDLSGFQPITGADDFLFRPLDGLELRVAGDPGGTLEVALNYEELARKDDFWPAAADKWDRKLVPLRNHQPSKEKVMAFMRFGSGLIASGNLTNQEWTFPKDNDPTNMTTPRKFAREVIYSKVPTTEAGLKIDLSDLETQKEMGSLLFSPLPAAGDEPLTIFIGNNTDLDMQNVVFRKQPRNASLGAHFAFLNRVAKDLGDGPIPRPVKPIGATEEDDPPGSGTDGYCGPDNGNGRKG
jgi:hypothetical protein